MPVETCPWAIGEKKIEDPDLSVPGQTPGSTTGADVLPADNETAADVLALIDHIKTVVKQEKNVELCCEVKFIGRQ